ncbi:hypothetical protein [Streptosporangium sp. NPDC051022]|uniref:hypothetical protein n=1 Tax=Streptosporangium sp. NPDC051022 TaxID=3155752 RepID=UPI0034210B37
MIVAALVAGAAAGAGNTVTQAVSDAYEGLKAMVRARLDERAGATVALDRFEENPEPWTEALSSELTAVGAGADRELLQAAALLLERAQAQGSQPTVFNTQFNAEVQGVVSGNHNQVQMRFGAAGRTDDERA